MKKFLVFFVVFVIATILIISPRKKEEEKRKEPSQTEEEMRAVYLSYIEFDDYLQGKEENDQKVQIVKILDTMKENHFNTVILHVRPFSDAIYPSDIYPYSHILTGEEGKDPGYDVLAYFLEQAHAKDLKVHAWINPYRVRNTTDPSVLSQNNPAVKWWGTNKVKIIDGKGIFYNPADQEVQNLIVEGVSELVKNYDVDGVQFDDYFYPSKDIDLENFEAYKENGGLLDIDHYRLEQVSAMVKRVYEAIKKEDTAIQFGIAPEGNMSNNYNSNYADTLTWMHTCGYLDYIMPQIYFGFENEIRPYIETIESWNKEIKCKEVSLIPALAFYKAGKLDEYAMSGKEEWIHHQDMIMRQVLIANSMSNYGGFSLFRYDNVFSSEPVFQEERENLQSLLTMNS